MASHESREQINFTEGRAGIKIPEIGMPYYEPEPSTIVLGFFRTLVAINGLGIGKSTDVRSYHTTPYDYERTIPENSTSRLLIIRGGITLRDKQEVEHDRIRYGDNRFKSHGIYETPIPRVPVSTEKHGLYIASEDFAPVDLLIEVSDTSYDVGYSAPRVNWHEGPFVSTLTPAAFDRDRVSFEAEKQQQELDHYRNILAKTVLLLS